MVKVLFGLAILVALAGLGMVGFGIPINEFSLGNLLIGTGVTALVGGFVLLGIAVAVAQLGRIAELLSTRPSPRSEPAAAPARRPAPARPPAPPAGAEPPARPPRPAEPRPVAARPVETPVEVQVERPRPRVPLRPEPPPVADEPEEVPLSPRAAPRPTPYSSPLQRDLDFVPGPRLDVDSPPPSNGRSSASEPPPASRPQPAWRSSASAPEPAVERSVFAALWESREQPIAPEHEATAPASDEEPAAPEPVARAPAPAPEPAEARPVSILKSGVVDGMAYTLYSDGSIEAELPGGTARFASINELRDHLEKHEQMESHS